MSTVLQEILGRRSVLRFVSAITWLSGVMLLVSVVIPARSPEIAEMGRNAISALAVGTILYQYCITLQTRRLSQPEDRDWTAKSASMLAVYFLLASAGFATQRWILLLALAAYGFVRWKQWKQLRPEDNT